MENLFSAFMSRRSSCNNRYNSSSGDISDPLKKEKRRTSFGSRSGTSSDRTSNSDLISAVDAQLMQIKEKLAAFRDQDTQFRERMDSLNDSVSELTSSRSSLSSFTPSECSDLDSLDEVYEEEEEFEHQIAAGQSKGLKLATKGGRNRPRVRCHQPMRRATSYPSSLYGHIEAPCEEEEEAMETQRHSTYSADQAINLYPKYDNPEEISTLF